jgi:hypothetical protein
MTNRVKYTIEDLDYIFIRARNKKKKWDSISLREIDNIQFGEWLFNKFKISAIREEDSQDLLSITSKPPKKTNKLTPMDRLSIINWLSEQGCQLIMIKKEARENF